MIELIMRSGLGNQMFEYAYARKIQQELGDNEIIINTEYMKQKDFRSYSLNNFKLNSSVIVLKDDLAKKSLKRFYVRLPFAFGLDFIPWRVLKKQALGETKYLKRSKKGMYYAHLATDTYPIIDCKRAHKYVFGFFQNASTVNGIEDILKNEFEVITPESPDNKAMIIEIESANSVCLHIRRGDYMNDKWKSMQVCNFNYYNRAVEEAKKVLNKPIFYVFSTGHDDIKWIKENYHFDAAIRYVDLDNPDFEEFRLMQTCKHFIISNSTFSWWAAFLSKNRDKVVWTPSIWRKYDPAANAIIPSDWRKISV